MNKKTNAVFAAVSICALITGCASSNAKYAVSTIQTLSVAYGDVMSIKPANTSDSKSLCSKGPNPKYDAACANLDRYVVARLVYLHSSRLIEQSFFAPAEWNLKEHSIVEVNPAGSFIATRMAASEQRQGCSWTGHSLEDLTGGAGMVKGFAMGMLIVPGVVVLADESIHQGGVECDGWSYKSLLQQKS